MNSAAQPPPTTWRGSTMAGRSAERREQLVRAGYELLGDEGAAATTMRAVCRHAGLSLRYFYESFPDRETLLVEVYDRTAHGLLDAVTTGLPGAPADETGRIRATFDSAARYFEADPRRGRIMFRETLADDTLRAHGTSVLPNFVMLAIAQLSPAATSRATAGTGRIPMPVSALSGALVALFLDWLAGNIDTTRDEVVEYATRLTIALLDIT
ncbi:TetR/AcrR family transcriptional regulator [Nocardia australiensis]|uniref:TetR/AcrR family transcriptional regulator n=1 Tax=Nocardia australiensis TaxID=2887191 RepID=UPI001D15B53E|nr:TetR/AcrR family transcriptional regulator [Nocardia australiensis]